MTSNHDELDRLNDNLELLNKRIKQLKLVEYIEFINKPFKMFYSNFMWGLFRGLGMAVGFTIFSAVVIYLLRHLVPANIPLIGNFIAEIVKIVLDNLRK